ncbi:MAG: DUF5702 domain-containing protein [Lachnospiraceae bacterium]|nr:DUF5702 domain-containing protein [Lachnospiraceae bacterium]
MRSCHKKGYLTLYLSLCLTLILSFVLTVLEGARRSTVRMEGECAADIGMNSILAEYHRELLEQYDLLFVDMSYGTSMPEIENTAQHLRAYIQKNAESTSMGMVSPRDWLGLSVDKARIMEISIASDAGGNVMKRQALEYMKSFSAEGILVELLDKTAVMDTLGFDSRDITAERSEIQSQIERTELPLTEDENGQQIEMELNNPADHVNRFRNSFLLGLILGDTSPISGNVVRQEDYISQRAKITGNGLAPGYKEPGGAADDLLFDCYLFDKCGWYGNEREKSLLKYQIEYIIAGKASDMENLEQVAKRLVGWREVANVVYLFSDAVKCGEAEALANSLTAVLLVPELAQPVKYAILFAWAYVESLTDVKCLLQGGRVPLIKTSADWRTDLDSVLDFSGELSASGDGGNGMDYKDYLRVMLFLEGNVRKNMRAMDLMEMDIRQTPGNSQFRMDACFESFLAEMSISSAFGYRLDLQKRYGYH